MARYLLVGDTIADAITITDPTGTAVDPDTGPTVTATLPDGTTTAATVTKTATGAYTATLVATLPGRHLFTWTASGVGSADFPHTTTFDVHAADPRHIISLDDARAALNIAATDRTNDTELALYIGAATAIIEDEAGPALADTITETHSGRGRAGIALHHAGTVTTVTEDGTELASSGWSVDEAHILWRGTYPGAGTWSAATPANVVVTLTVGASVIPDHVLLAARELVRHLYAIGQQPWRQPYGGGLEDVAMTTTPSGYAIPNRVRDLLRPLRRTNRMPGLA